MTMEEAIRQASATVGIIPPAGRIDTGKWIKADIVGKGASGRGDGRLMCDDSRATAMNWTTGEVVTVWLNESRTPEEKRRYADQRRADVDHDRERALKAGRVAAVIVKSAQPDEHPYLNRKGFALDRPLTIGAELLASIAGAYLVPEGGKTAIVVPARIGQRLASVQLIWSSGAKKFLAGGEMGGAAHRISTGADTWLCEGYATGLSLRMALKGLNRRDTVLVCFSASNIAKVAATIQGRCFVAADHDAPPVAKPNQFGGLGAGEFYAVRAGAPYIMPPTEGMDINDMHQSAGIFAVQKLISTMIRQV
ncbi:MAG: toprim domain-containing protein [Devosia sp.]